MNEPTTASRPGEMLLLWSCNACVAALAWFTEGHNAQHLASLVAVLAGLASFAYSVVRLYDRWRNAPASPTAYDYHTSDDDHRGHA